MIGLQVNFLKVRYVHKIDAESEEMSAKDDLTQDPFPDQEQGLDEGDSDPEISKLEGKKFSIRKP